MVAPAPAGKRVRAPGRTPEAVTNRIVSRRTAIAVGAALILMTSASANPSLPASAQAAGNAPAAPAEFVMFGLTEPPSVAVAERAREAVNPPASRSVVRKARPAKRNPITRPRARHRPEAKAAHVSAGRVGAMLTFAYRQLGEPYRWGADGPNSWDCSGLTLQAAARAGIRLPHKAAAQGGMGYPVSRGDARPGDLVLWGDYHVGLYVGHGRVLHAPKPGDHVRISTIWGSPRFRRIT